MAGLIVIASRPRVILGGQISREELIRKIREEQKMPLDSSDARGLFGRSRVRDAEKNTLNSVGLYAIVRKTVVAILFGSQRLTGVTSLFP
jgi:hypothetical protein